MLATGIGTFSPDKALDYLVQERSSIKAVILGWPVNMDGSSGHAVAMVEEFEKRLRKSVPEIEILHIDERLSSFRAENQIREAVSKKKKRKDKGLVDEVAATILLQDFLDAL